jgi:catechol 2,3-dioxygenase-like lactoylglutathione lyase family enzyme
MPQSLAHIALIVRDYNEAIAWFTGVLGFTLAADERVEPEQAAVSPGHGCKHPVDVCTSSGPPAQPEQDKRWVLVAPPGAGPDAATLLLARASSPEQAAFLGNQAGGRVFLFLKSDDFDRDYSAYRARGVRFVREPKQAPYGKVAVFEDLYGNLWDLIQSAMPNTSSISPCTTPAAPA